MSLTRLAWSGTTLEVEGKALEAALPKGKPLFVRLDVVGGTAGVRNGGGTAEGPAAANGGTAGPQTLGRFHASNVAKNGTITVACFVRLDDILASWDPACACDLQLVLTAGDQKLEALGRKTAPALLTCLANGCPATANAQVMALTAGGAPLLRIMGAETPEAKAWANASAAERAQAARAGRAAAPQEPGSGKGPEGKRAQTAAAAAPAPVPVLPQPEATAIRWLDDTLTIQLQLDATALALATDGAYLQVPSPDGAIILPGLLAGSRLYASLDAAKLCQVAKADAIAQAPLQLVMRTGATKTTVDVPVPQDPAVRRAFMDGLCLHGKRLVLPDVPKDGPLTFVTVGKKANTAADKRFKLYKRSSFGNRLLFFAGSKGTDALFAVARALRDGTLTTSMDYLGKPKYRCLCTAPDLPEPLALDMAEMPGIDKTTMLDQGKSFEELGKNQNHEEQFSHLLELLTEFDELCQANGIEYYLAYGTLIGAIRHKGFIPWDHDVDLLMTRDNYWKLRALFDEGRAPAGRRLEDQFSDEHCQIAFGRYMDTQTTRYNPMMPRGTAHRGKAGIFMDIFILIPLEGEGQEELDAQAGELLALADELHTSERGSTTRIPAFYPARERLSADIASMGRAEALRQWAARLYGKDEASARYLMAATDSRPWPLIYPHEWFGTPQRVNLLGHDFSVPANPSPQLVDEYGADWRHFPSDTHLPLERELFNSLTLPCDIAIDQANADSDEDALIAARDARRAAMEQDTEYLRTLYPMLFHMGGYLARIHRDRVMEQAGVTVEEALDQGRWDLLAQATEPYFRTWELTFGRFVDVYYPLEPIWFKATVYAQLCSSSIGSSFGDQTAQAGDLAKLTSNNSMHRAWGLIRKRRRTGIGGPLDIIEWQTITAVEDLVLIRDLLEAGDLEGARIATDRVLKVMPQSTDALAADLYLRLLAARDQDDKGELLALRMRADRLLAGTGLEQFAYCAALAAHLHGSAGEALALYGCLLATSHDGMLLECCAAATKELMNRD